MRIEETGRETIPLIIYVAFRSFLFPCSFAFGFRGLNNGVLCSCDLLNHVFLCDHCIHFLCF